MKYLTLIALTTTISSPAWAAPETYALDESHTLPRFSYSHFGYSTQLSRFDKAVGKIVIDRQAKSGSINVSVDTKSVNTGSALFNEHIQGEDFLHTAQYPLMTFTSTQLKFDGENPVTVEGTLTLKGISKPVTLTITSFQCMPHPMLKKPACGANASTIIKRSDFNMGKYAPNVGDEVTVDIPVEAIQE